MKMIAIYLVENLDGEDNSGNVGRIWTNPVCDSSLSKCGISKDAGEYRVEDYFNFARSATKVNAEINSQEESIAVGTYRYIRMDFAGVEGTDKDEKVPNLKFGKLVDNEEVAYEVRPNWGNGYLAELEDPIEVNDGDSIIVTLSYDYSNTFYDDTTLRNIPADAPDDDLSNWFCGGDAITDDSGGTNFGPCIHFSGFIPTAEKG